MKIVTIIHCGILVAAYRYKDSDGWRLNAEFAGKHWESERFLDGVPSILQDLERPALEETMQGFAEECALNALQLGVATLERAKEVAA